MCAIRTDEEDKGEKWSDGSQRGHGWTESSFMRLYAAPPQSPPRAASVPVPTLIDGGRSISLGVGTDKSFPSPRPHAQCFMALLFA